MEDWAGKLAEKIEDELYLLTKEYAGQPITFTKIVAQAAFWGALLNEGYADDEAAVKVYIMTLLACREVIEGHTTDGSVSKKDAN